MGKTVRFLTYFCFQTKSQAANGLYGPEQADFTHD
jgi:hypothetical protein